MAYTEAMEFVIAHCPIRPARRFAVTGKDFEGEDARLNAKVVLFYQILV